MQIDKKEYHRHTFQNHDEIEHSTMCGCASCQRVYPASEIVDYQDDMHGSTAICPYCFVDAVIGDASGLRIDEQVLNYLYREWF